MYVTVEPRAIHLVDEEVRTKVAMRYSVTNLDVREAVALLDRRWAMERNYRELKQLTGFARHQGRSYDGLTRYLALAAVVYIFLFWFALSEGSASLYAASRELPAAILLALHPRCPLCECRLPFARPGWPGLRRACSSTTSTVATGCRFLLTIAVGGGAPL